MTAPNLTPPRSVRVPEHIWRAAKVRAEAEGVTVSSVVVAALREYGQKGGKA